MNDGYLILGFSVLFWLVVWLWIRGTDPLAGRIVRGLWFVVKWILLIVCGAALLLALTGMSSARHGK